MRHIYSCIDTRKDQWGRTQTTIPPIPLSLSNPVGVVWGPFNRMRVCDTYPHVEMLSNTNLIAPNAIFLCNFHISEKSPNTISLPPSVIMLAEKDIVNFLKEHHDITDRNWWHNGLFHRVYPKLCTNRVPGKNLWLHAYYLKSIIFQVFGIY